MTVVMRWLTDEQVQAMIHNRETPVPYACDHCGTVITEHVHGDLPETAKMWRPNMVQFLCDPCNEIDEASLVEDVQ